MKQYARIANSNAVPVRRLIVDERHDGAVRKVTTAFKRTDRQEISLGTEVVESVETAWTHAM